MKTKVLCVQGRKMRPNLYNRIPEDPRPQNGAGLQLGGLHIHHTSMDDLPGARHHTRTRETPMNKPHKVPALTELTVQQKHKIETENYNPVYRYAGLVGRVQRFGIIHTFHLRQTPWYLSKKVRKKKRQGERKTILSHLGHSTCSSTH